MVALKIIILLLFFKLIKSEMNAQETSRMLGMDTVHDFKINKDTIIARNMKLEKPKQNLKDKRGNEKEPDWSYSPIPKDVRPYVEQFKRNMTECLKEVEDKGKRTVKQLSPFKEPPIHGECLIACVLKRNGVIERGKINKGNLILLVSKFYAKNTKFIKKLEKNIDRCVEMSARYEDECVLASQLNDCTNSLMVNNKQEIVINY